MSYDIPSDPEEELPDWLKGMQSEEDRADHERDDFLPDEGGEDKPDWLETQPFKSEPSPIQGDEEEEEVPDWLASIRESESALKKEIEGIPESKEEEDDEPDWLINLREQQAQEMGDQAPDEETGAGGDLISRIQSLQEGEGAPQEEDEAEIPAGDWVSGLEDESASDQDMPWDFDSQEADEGAPDWLEGTGGEGAKLGGDVPDWLHEAVDEASSPQPAFTEETTEWEQEKDSAAAGVESEYPDLPGDPGEVEMPSWLASLQDSVDDEATEAAPTPSDALDPSSPDEEEGFILEPTDLPDWLDEVEPSDYAVVEEESIVEETPVAEEDVEAEEVDIAPAELPSWLQAMRPVEGISTSAPWQGPRPGEGEMVGPLAGLSDVLPAEPGIVHFGTSSPPSQDLDLPQTHKVYAELLQSMIASEEDTPPVQRRRVALPQQILRWAIAIILYAVVLLPIIWGSQLVMLPSTQDIPPENLAVASLVNDLQENAPVLVAFEYQPGLSGEMTTASAAVIDHLLNQGAIPVIISTHPTGPGLVENFLQNTQSQHYLITSGGYINLGYISGGTAALLNFATDPRAAVPLQLNDGSSRWDQPPLANIRSIRDFALVLVITDDSDTARGWIEQVQPILVDPNNPAVKTFLAMVVSAQAEPLVYPYYLTAPKQVDGLVSGVRGGAYYENTINQNILARDYWDAFSAGLSITILVILFGGLFNLARAYMASRQAAGQRGNR
jgi:hypothetical protein